MPETIKPSFQLERPSAARMPAFLAMAREFVAEANQRYVAALRNPEAYLAQQEQYNAGVNLPAGRVPETIYWAVRDDQVLAVSRLRHRLTPALEQISGHIGYEIRPSLRRQGIGTQLLALTLVEARVLGLTRVLLTCDVSNIGSARIIQRNGGVLEDERTLPGHPEPIARYWIAL